MSSIPTLNDWGDYESDMDAVYAYKIFGGKSNDDVQKDFKRNVIERADELRFMPIIPFKYYIFGFKKYVMSNSFPENSAADAASCFLILIEEKLQGENRQDVLFVIDELWPTIKYIGENQKLYDAAEEVYGNFIDIVQVIKKSKNN